MTHDAISPLDGRYFDKLAPVSALFSEKALMARRCEVEVRYLFELDRLGLFAPLEAAQREAAEALLSGFGDREFAQVKEIETRVHHDVKACELFLRARLALRNPEMIHFGLTSEDVNNLAYSLILSDFRRTVQVPRLESLMRTLGARVREWRDAPFPAHTHGQPASPTTAGKEVAVFLSRLLRQYRQLRDQPLRGKLNGATGNWSALHAAFPDVDWPAFCARFVASLGLDHNAVTTQVEGHDAWCEYFDVTRRIDNILLDFDVDFWLYISRGFFAQKAEPGQVGSSVMPHKVNPIRFENSEGNLSLANALLAALADRLPRSRMQRDLSDSTVERNIGVALAHHCLGVEEARLGFEALTLDADRCRAEIDAHPEVLAEPIQTILRAAGVAEPYEQLRRLTQGKAVSLADIRTFIRGLDVAEPVRARLLALEPAAYIGLAPRVCDLVLNEMEDEIGSWA